MISILFSVFESNTCLDVKPKLNLEFWYLQWYVLVQKSWPLKEKPLHPFYKMYLYFIVCQQSQTYNPSQHIIMGNMYLCIKWTKLKAKDLELSFNSKWLTMASSITIVFMVYIVVLVSEIIQIITCNNYDGFQLVNFLFSQKNNWAFKGFI
jgi:hypothetical protein